MSDTLTEKGAEERRRYHREYMRKRRQDQEKQEKEREQERERYKKNPKAHKDKMARYWNRRAQAEGEKPQQEGT